MRTLSPIPVLWLCGAPGAGQTTVGWEIFTQLTRDGVEAGYRTVQEVADVLVAQTGWPGRPGRDGEPGHARQHLARPGRRPRRDRRDRRRRRRHLPRPGGRARRPWRQPLVPDPYRRHGRAVAHGCARAGPGPPGTPDPAVWLRQIAIAPIETGTCARRRESAGYRPSPSLRHLIKIRSPQCGYPGCRRPATRTDDDHTIPTTRAGRRASAISIHCAAGTIRRNRARAGGSTSGSQAS
jgi:hypothetical protein